MVSSPKPGSTLIKKKADSKEAAPAYKFENDYDLDTRLRSGSYGVVYTTKHKKTQEQYAVKIIDRLKLKPKDDKAVFREVGILKDLLDVPNIVRLIDFYVEPTTFYVVQVYAKGGDVFDRLDKRVSYTEKDARDLAVLLLRTMKELHTRKICHRDLKPENLLLLDEHDDSRILLADFGFAKYVPPEGLKTRCGTPAFVAPEIIVGKSSYNEKADMWSVGCLLYMLIGGYPPFQDSTHKGLFRKIRAADFCFHAKYWNSASLHAKQLITSLLTVDPYFRFNAQQALDGEWLHLHAEQLSKRDLSVSLKEIKNYNARRTLKSAMHAVLWSVHSAFRHEKVSDFSAASKKWDEDDLAKLNEQKKDPGKSQPQFSMSKINRERFESIYEIGNKIHRGSFAVVKECRHIFENKKYAVKIVERSDHTVDEAVLHEVAVMNSLTHPNIVAVHDFFEEEEYYYIVMELMSGGDVFDRVISLKHYTEKDARDLTKFLLETVEYLHTKGVAHRDLKPQNLLLQSKENNAAIKVSDFGFARRVHTPKSLTTRCGTPSYVAPEILKNIPYDQSCDMWSVGIVVYVLLCGYTPFMEEQQEKMFDRIKLGDWKFDEKDWKDVSEEAKDLIKKLLVTTPETRLTATEALKSKWINQDSKLLSSRDLSQSLQTIQQKRPNLKNLAKAFMALGSVGKKSGLASSLDPIGDEVGAPGLT